jgi:hypothetical protein
MSLAGKVPTILVSYPKFWPLGPRKSLPAPDAGEVGTDDEAGRPLRACFFQYSSRNSGAICHFIPLPGSSVRRGTFWNALLSERLCRMEF